MTRKYTSSILSITIISMKIIQYNILNFHDAQKANTAHDQSCNSSLFVKLYGMVICDLKT